MNEEKKLGLCALQFLCNLSFRQEYRCDTFCFVWKMSKVFHHVMFTSAKILIVWSVFLILCQRAEEKKNMNVPECIYNMDDYLFVCFFLSLT